MVIFTFSESNHVPIDNLVKALENQREKLRKCLDENGIQTLIHYPISIHKQNAYLNLADDSYPLSEILNKEILSIPISPVMTDDSVNKVIEVMSAFS